MSELNNILKRSTLTKDEIEFILNKHNELVSKGVPEEEAQQLAVEILKNNALDTLQDIFAQLGIEDFKRVEQREDLVIEKTENKQSENDSFLNKIKKWL